MRNRGMQVVVWLLLIASMSGWAAAAAPAAGKITALLPVARIIRGAGKQAATIDAVRGQELVWDDLVRTEKGGRARITLADQSILSLGSQAELRIVKNDAKSQQTALQLSYGRLRAEVTTVTRQGGKFEVKTPTAVAGVIGTDFGTTTGIGQSDFICISGTVSVSNADPAVPGTVPCAPGTTTTVATGLAPTPPRPATPQQIQELIQDTEPAIISSLSPASALPGMTLDAAVSGSKLAAVNKVTVSGNGVTVALSGTPTDSGATVHMVVGGDAAPGPRTLTLAKPSGAAAAAIFTILAPPGSGTDVVQSRKSYLDTFDLERQAAINGLNALGVGVQQAADVASQTAGEANSKLSKPVDLTDFSAALKTETGGTIKSLVDAGTLVNSAAGTASSSFAAAFDAALKDLQTRSSGGTAPDAAFLAAVKAAFDKINGGLLEQFGATNKDLGTTASAHTTTISNDSIAVLEQIAAAAAKQGVNAGISIPGADKSLEQGFDASFSAGSAASALGIAVSSYRWVLCDPSYKPSVFGVPLPAGTPPCNALAGFASSSSDFAFPTCSLAPNDYVARLTVLDANNNPVNVDIRLRVNAPAYDNPTDTLYKLAAAYSALQSSQFLQFFSTDFSGLTSLQENIRKTFPQLSSMQINLKVSQSTVNCNDATVRADWDQKYTFTNDNSCASTPTGGVCNRTVFNQTEQLTARMVRIPGKGWYINDFQGDNGTVQGVPAGPITTDTAIADLTISNLKQVSGASRRSATLAVAAGTATYQATISNIGSADLTVSPDVVFTLLDADGATVATDTEKAPVPLAKGASETVNGTITNPGTGVRLTAAVNPACKVAEKSCDAANVTALDVAAPALFVDLGLSNFAVSGTLTTGVAATATVDVKNTGNTAAAATSQNLLIEDRSSGTTVLGKADIPAIPAGGKVTVSVSFTPIGTGAKTLFAEINPSLAGDPTPADNTISIAVTVNPAPLVDLSLSNFVVSGTLTAGVAGSATVDVSNIGNTASAATSQNLLIEDRPTSGTRILGKADIPAIPAGGKVTVTVSFTPVAAGSTTFFAEINPRVAGDPTIPDDTTSVTVTVNPAPFVDLSLSNFLVSGTLTAGVAATGTVDVDNTGNTASAATSQNLLIEDRPTSGTRILGKADIPSVPARGRVRVTVSFTPIASGSTTFFAEINPRVAGDPTVEDDTTSVTVTVNPAAAANYTITSAVFTGYPDPATGANALQVSTTSTNQNLDVTVTNNGSASPSGTITVTASCTPVCTATRSTTIPAPAAGTSAVATIPTGTINLPPGAYTLTVTLSTSIPQTTTADDSLSRPFEVFDFNLLGPASVPVQNVLVGATNNFLVKLDETGDVTKLAIPISLAPDPNITFSFTSPQAADSFQTISAAVSSSHSLGAGAFVVTGTRRGENRTFTQNVNFYTAAWQDITYPANSPSNPVKVTAGGTTPTTADFKLTGNFVGTASVSVAPVSGFTLTLSSTSANANDVITLSVQANSGATAGTVVTIVLTATIPNTSPSQTVTIPFYVLPTSFPDLAILTAPTPSRTVDSSFPLLSGEPLNYSVTVTNRGGVASTAGAMVHLAFASGGQVASAALPSIPAGGSATVSLHLVAPDPVATGTSSLMASVDPDPAGDLDPTNNTFSFTLSTSDWGLSTDNPGGSNLSPIFVAPGFSAAATVRAFAFSGSVAGPIQLINGNVSTRLTATLAASSLSHPNLFTSDNISAASNAANGEYLAQVLGRFVDGSTVTAQRQTTVFVDVGTGAPAAQVFVTPSPDNTSTPRQLNGTLPEQETLTVTKSGLLCDGPCTGSVDLHFTDDPKVVSTPQQIKALPYKTPATATFAAAENADGSINPGDANTIVSATSVQITAVRTLPITPVVGTQQTSLLFRVGDIFISVPPGCTAIKPNGGTASLTIGYVPVSGFNAPSVDFQWTLPSGVTVDRPSGTEPFTGSTYGSGSDTFTFTNSNTTEMGPVTLIFQLTFRNSLASATKFFAVPVQLSNICTAANGGSALGIVHGSWSRYSVSLQSMGARLAPSAAADLQLSSSQISFTPSVPAAGDTLEVRFQITNAGDADALQVPIALQVGGKTVAIDKFDVRAGATTLAGLEWAGVQAPSRLANMGRHGASGDENIPERNAGQADTAVDAVLVVDPAHTVTQKSAAGKSARLAGFTLRGGAVASGGKTAGSAAQRVFLELPEGGCVGFRFASGAGGQCDGADAALSVEDLATAKYSLTSDQGVGDMGAAQFSAARGSAVNAASFSHQVVAVAGHTYAVQLQDGKTGWLTVQAILTYGQLDAQTRRLFGKSGAHKVVRKLGGETGAAEAGDVASGARQPAVYFDVLYQIQ